MGQACVESFKMQKCRVVAIEESNTINPQTFTPFATGLEGYTYCVGLGHVIQICSQLRRKTSKLVFTVNMTLAVGTT